MGTIAITPQQERILDAINQRIDQLDKAAAPSVSGILAAAYRLPAADRLAVHRRLSTIGHPDVEWASALR